MANDKKAFNILIMTTDFPPLSGGISTYTKEIASALSKTDNIFVFVPGKTEQSSDENNFPFRVIRTPSIPFIRILALFIYLPYLLRQFDIDLVLHTVWPTALCSHLWHFLFPHSYFVSIHASEILDDKRTLRRRLKGLLRKWRAPALRKASGIFPISHYSAGLLKTYKIDMDRIRIITNGVDTRKFTPSSPKEGNAKKILTVARLDLHKGHDHVLEALTILKKEGLKPEYVIVGSGDEEANLKKMVSRLGLESQVSFVGFIPDEQLPDIYRNCDIFVMPSREIPGRVDLIEGFGISFLEASASGLPVVAGASGGVPDAIINGKTGLLVNPDKPEDIAEAMKKLLVNTDYAEKLGREGRQWTETKMNWDCIAEQIRQSFFDLCEDDKK